MNRYRSNAPRPLLGLAATALAVATLGLGVVAPSLPQAGGEAAVSSAHVTEAVRIEPSRIDVIGVRETVFADDRATGRPAS